MTFLEYLAHETSADLCLEDKNFKNILWQCGLLGVFIFLSLLWMPFVFVSLILGAIFICMQKDGKQLYFLVFLLPLISIFKIKEGGSNIFESLYLLSYLIALCIANLGIRFFIDIIKKRKRINWAFTITTALFLVFILAFANYNALSYLFSLVLGIGLIYIAYCYKDDIDFKQLVLLFSFGLLFSVFSGLFRPVLKRLEAFSVYFYDYRMPRFAGASSNPNILGGELALCLACIFALFVNKQLKVLFWPLVAIFLIAAISTISKATFIILVSIYVLFVIVYLIKNRSKKSWLTILISTVFIVSILLIFNNKISVLFRRMGDSITTTTTVTTVEGVNKQTTSTSFNINQFSTGRTELWVQYIKESLSSTRYALVGHGVGADFIGSYNNSVGFGPHNTFIQALYYTGIVGYLFILAMMITAFDFKRIKEFKLHNLITFLAFGLYLFAIEFFSFRLSIYLILILPALFYKNEPINSNGKIENKEQNDGAK